MQFFYLVPDAGFPTEHQTENNHLEQMAQALYRSMFVTYDNVPEDCLVSSELGTIPSGWSIKCLGDVTRSVKKRVGENCYKVFSAIMTGELQLSEEYFTKQVFSKDISNYLVVEPYDITYNPARANIGSIGLNKFGYTGCVSPVYVVIRPEPSYHYFLDFFTKSKRFRAEVKSRSSGSVRQAFSYADFSQIKVVYPPTELVEEFNLRYGLLLKTMSHYKEENSRLVTLRNTLLPRLMSGELDVSNLDL